MQDICGWTNEQGTKMDAIEGDLWMDERSNPRRRRRRRRSNLSTLTIPQKRSLNPSSADPRATRTLEGEKVYMKDGENHGPGRTLQNKAIDAEGKRSSKPSEKKARGVLMRIQNHRPGKGPR